MACSRDRDGRTPVVCAATTVATATLHPTMTRTLFLFALTCGAFLPAQRPASEATTPQHGADAGTAPAAQQLPEDLAALARLVDATHRVGQGPDEIRSFDATLKILGLGDDRAEAELAVKFLDWLDPQLERRRPLIRYRLLDAARPVEQGLDRIDYWGLADGKVRGLRDKESATDLASVRRNLQLARQLLRFLDPGAVLRSLAEPTRVEERELQLGRSKAIATKTVAGVLPAFPLRLAGGENVPVKARIWVGKDDGRLLALQAEPIEPPPAGAPSGEFVAFDDHRVVAGRLVPWRTTHFDLDAKGRHAQIQVVITTLELAAERKPEDLDRPR